MAKADDLTPPRGASFRRTADGFVLGATMRSRAGGFLAAAAITLTLPAVVGIAQYSPSDPISWFALFGVLLGGVSGIRTMGKVQVIVSAGRCRILIGIGGIGASRTVDWSAITTIREDSAEMPGRRRHPVRWTRIVLCGENLEVLLVPPWLDAMAPPMLSDDRRRYIVDVLRALVDERIALENERRRSGPFR